MRKRVIVVILCVVLCSSVLLSGCSETPTKEIEQKIDSISFQQVDAYLDSGKYDKALEVLEQMEETQETREYKAKVYYAKASFELDEELISACIKNLELAYTYTLDQDMFDQLESLRARCVLYTFEMAIEAGEYQYILDNQDMVVRELLSDEDEARYCLLVAKAYNALEPPKEETVDSTEKPEESAQTETNTSNASKHNYSSTNKKDDPYDVYDYDDGDDFADDYAYEFDDRDYDGGYDDAYDYWEDAYED